MTVKRIITNIKAADPLLAQRFYHEVLELDIVMDLDWIRTYASNESHIGQISVASEGGSEQQSTTRP